MFETTTKRHSLATLRRAIFSILFCMSPTLLSSAETVTPTYYPLEEWNTATLGVAGAGRTFSDNAGAILTNPAGLAYLSQSGTFEAAGGIYDRGDADQMVFSVVDGKTNKIIGGFQFLKYSSNEYSKYSYAAAAAYPYHGFFFGITSRYITYEGKKEGSKNVWSNTVGALAPLSKNLVFSALRPRI